MDIFKLKEKLDEMKIPEEYYLLLKEDLFCEKTLLSTAWYILGILLW